MGLIIIYLDDATERKIKAVARSSHLSLSHWIARIIEEKVRAKWPQEIVSLAGSWKDDFPALEEIRSNPALAGKREREL